MPKVSAGLLVARPATSAGWEALLVHPGGPYFAKKDEGAWSIPKGLVEPGEQMLATALREFREELGLPPPEGEYLSLGSVKQKGGKLVHAWAVLGEVETDDIQSNLFELEWPPRSGKMREFPEVDRAEYFDMTTAPYKILPAQRPFLDRLVSALT